MATFVLVHGAWHGGWCYRRVAERLRKRGHAVHTPTMSGLCERSHLLGSTMINLSTHIQDIVNTIRWRELEDVVLCGHSYGGLVITGVADAVPDKVRSLVYLDAIVAEDGDSLMDRVSEETRRIFMEGAAEHGGYGVPPIPAATFKVNEADQAWVDAMCTLMPLAAVREKIRLTGAYKRIARRMFIYAGGRTPSTFTPYYERLRDDPGWAVHVLPCGHDIMVDMPEELTDLLEQAV